MRSGSGTSTSTGTGARAGQTGDKMNLYDSHDTSDAGSDNGESPLVKKGGRGGGNRNNKNNIKNDGGEEGRDDDSSPVLPEGLLRLRYMSSEEIEANYFRMCAAFSVNHACANCCLTYASTVLGNKLGSIGNGLLYLTFAVAAAFLSKPFVLNYGARWSLVVACLGYCIFIVGFFFAVLGANNNDSDDATEIEPTWAVYLAACVCGGLSGGILWTAQGRYFACSARLAANDSGQPVEETNNSFAATFAFLYLGSEMILKLVATLLYSISWGGIDSDIVVFGVYPCIALGSAAFMMFVQDLHDQEKGPITAAEGLQQAWSSFCLSFSELRLSLLLPYQMTFGFATSFVTYYVFGTIVSDSTVLGETYVGLLSALVMFAGAMTAIPASKLSTNYGKPIMMTGGGIALAAFGLTCFVFNTTILGTWEMILPLMIIFGVARGVWVSWLVLQIQIPWP
jgi:hypothetical protein